MTEYWSRHKTFRSFQVILINIAKIFIYDKHSIPNIITCIIMNSLFLIGVGNLVQHRKTGAEIKIISLTCTPLLLHLFLSSAFQLYPIDRKFILYALPCMIYICAIGFDYIRILFHLKPSKWKLLVTAVPIVFLLCFLDGFPIRKYDIKEGIEQIKENITEGENIFTDFWSEAAFQYYKNIGYVKTNAYVSSCEYGWGIEKCTDELKKLGGRNWLLFVGIDESFKEGLINHLDSLGYDKIKEFKKYDSSTYLYDFGESTITK
jgi:hypothetical protein